MCPRSYGRVSEIVILIWRGIKLTRVEGRNSIFCIRTGISDCSMQICFEWSKSWGAIEITIEMPYSFCFAKLRVSHLDCSIDIKYFDEVSFNVFCEDVRRDSRDNYQKDKAHKEALFQDQSAPQVTTAPSKLKTIIRWWNFAEIQGFCGS